MRHKALDRPTPTRLIPRQPPTIGDYLFGIGMSLVWDAMLGFMIALIIRNVGIGWSTVFFVIAWIGLCIEGSLIFFSFDDYP